MNFTSDYIELNLLHEVFIYFMYKHGVNIFANILHDFYMNFTLNLINYMSFSYISCIYMELRSGERRAGRAGPGSCGGLTVIVRLAEANRRPGGGLAGLALGQGQSLEDALSGKVSVAEGVASAPAVRELAARIGVDAPICEAVAAILAGEVGVEAAITGLLSRPLKSER